MEDVYIVGAARTPMGGMQGALADASASQLGGVAIAAALAAGDVAPDDVDELLMGCVLPAGQGQAPARQAGFAAGLGEDVPATTINKMCGSGMKTTMMGYDQLALGHGQVMVTGGMESMTPAQDAYALRSLERALAAQASGAVAAEIAPVTVAGRKAKVEVVMDEQPGTARPDKIPHLKPAFREGGTVTAANSSSISDGAAALVLANASGLAAKGYTPRARVMGHASHAQAPGWFTTAPVPAARKLLDRLGWSVADVDLWEVNEAFAVVPMAFMHEMELSPDVVNVYGGACALGHPIGASGARILVTLLNALERHDLKRGVAAICIGGGEGTAIAIERM